MKTYEYENPNRVALTEELRNAASKNKAAIWAAVAEKLSKTGKNRCEVNVGDIAKNASEKEAVVVPGRVLGFGKIGKMEIAAFSFTQGARKKIIESGGKAMSIPDLIKKSPKGSNVRILG
ncbi:MAG: hypothetical protein MSIBF_04320 [Candidatus Altiarchaeales archaeon IMC4]|nr:MAG: hypothetical protein MSIBF_04320 [Candidatus Altiarchaeales archaeon IMC4]